MNYNVLVRFYYALIKFDGLQSTVSDLLERLNTAFRTIESAQKKEKFWTRIGVKKRSVLGNDSGRHGPMRSVSATQTALPGARDTGH